MIENKTDNILNKLNVYLYNVLGVQISISSFEQEDQKKLPFYLKEGYLLFRINLFSDNDFIIVIPRDEDLPTISQLSKNLEKIEDLFNRKPILIVSNVPSYIRKRLIQRRINFIVPGKQLYVPHVRIHLDEKKQSGIKTAKNLLPSSQVLFLYHLLNKNDTLEKYSLSELSKKFNYSGMGITNAVRKLEMNDLCEIVGAKGKNMKFPGAAEELWNQARDLMINPVKELYYATHIPKNTICLLSNVTALAEYTNLNPSEQIYYAVDYRSFKIFKNDKSFEGLNKFEGKYCLEIWRYDPELLIEESARNNVVDPLSLYLSLKNNKDERIELAIDQLINKHIW